MVRVRFAPSPTGFLHVGNARTALFNWFFARHSNGKFILRIEDTDIERSKEDYTNRIFSDLKWLGLNWDEGPDIGGEFGPYIQSQRTSIYKEYVQKLLDQGKAYYCYCSVDDLKLRRQDAIEKGLSVGYDNRCRNISEADLIKFRSQNRIPAIRFKVPHEELVVNDLIRGQVKFDTSLISDFIIMKSEGGPSFNIAVCVDDCIMKISHVIRGEDHLSNTPKHILLIRALGFKEPAYAHMSLTMGPGRTKLSKRTLDTSIAQYRQLGFLPQALINYMALLGWSSPSGREILSVDELIKEFNIQDMVRHQAVFDPEKLDWVSGQYIRQADLDSITKIAIDYLIMDNIAKEPIEYEYIKKVIGAVRGHLSCISEISQHAEVFFNEDIDIDTESREYLKNTNFKSILEAFFTEINKIEYITDDNFKNIFNNVKQALGIKGEVLYKPIRLALTGTAHGPELNIVMPILGKEKCLNRIKRAMERL